MNISVYIKNITRLLQYWYWNLSSILHNERKLYMDRFHQHFCITFLSKQDEKLFWLNAWHSAKSKQICQTTHLFGKLHLTDRVNFISAVWGRMLVKVNSESVSRQLIAWRTKFGKIKPQEELFAGLHRLTREQDAIKRIFWEKKETFSFETNFFLPSSLQNVKCSFPKLVFS